MDECETTGLRSASGPVPPQPVPEPSFSFKSVGHESGSASGPHDANAS